MRPNYKSELDFVLLKKHRTLREAARIREELKELTENSQALAVLAGNPYDVNTVIWDMENLRLDISTGITFAFKDANGRGWKLYGNIERVTELMEKHHPVTLDSLETYSGILLDLLEWSERTGDPIPAWRFHLRVYFNDDIDAFIEELKSEFGE